MSLVGWLHDRFVYGRRVHTLAGRLAALFPEGSRVLDVGCGDGLLASQIRRRKPTLEVVGIDTVVRRRTHIGVAPYNGVRIPYDDGSFDAVMLVDVLHHTSDPMLHLREAKRVARETVVIKDHIRDGLLAGPTLRMMDWVGNARHGVALPFNFWPLGRWLDAFGELGLTIDTMDRRLKLYPVYADWVFGRSLHFIAKLAITQPARAQTFTQGDGCDKGARVKNES